VANPKNIIKHQFKKGTTGNPKGRPKLPDINELLAKVLSEEKDGKTAAEVILMAQRAKATKGDVRAAEFLMDRGYGKAKQSMDVTTKGESVNNLDLSHLTFEQIKELQGGNYTNK
jgi:hypothetical protein